MASTFTLTSHSYEGRYMYLECSQSKDIATNKSTISWKLSSTGGSVNYYTSKAIVQIGGETVYDSGKVAWDTKKFPAAKGSTSGTITVNHDDYGNKELWVQIDVMIYDGVLRAYGGTWHLDNIPRQATITSVSDFTDVDDPSFTFSNLGNFRMDVWLEPNPVGDHLCVRTDIPNTGSYKWQLSDEEREALRNSCRGNKCPIRVGLYTHIGDVIYADYKDKTYTMTESEATKPSLSMNVSLNNGLIPSEYASKFAGRCIQGKTRVDVSLSAEGKYGANIISYSTTVDGKTYTSSSFTTDVINSSANVQANAKDSRGFAGTAEQHWGIFCPYSKPLVATIDGENAIRCYRSDGNGVRVGNSTSVWIKAKRTYSSVDMRNACALQWRRKLLTESWNDSHVWTDLIKREDRNTVVYNSLLEGVVFDKKTSYTVQIRAIDDIGEYDLKTFEIPTEDVALHLGSGGKNVSIGTYCNGLPDYRFYSDWVGQFDKGLWGTSINFNVTDVLTFPEECTDGITPIVINASTNKENLPSGNYDYSVGIIHKRAADQYNVILVDYVTGKIAINVHLSGTWTGWKYITPQ